MTNKTVTMPLELVEEVVEQLDDFITGDLLARLKALLADPAVERQEPLAWIVISPDGKEFSELQSSEDSANDLSHDMDGDLHPNHEGGHHEVKAVFLEQPAPVAVVLPDREHVHSKTLPFRNPAIGDGYISGWNSCIDKVKELNQ